MKVTVHHFATGAEAAAFAEGVELYSKDGMALCRPDRQEAQDHRVAVHDYRPIGPDGEPFDDPFDVARVVFSGSDRVDQDDLCPLCGCKDRAQAEGVNDE